MKGSFWTYVVLAVVGAFAGALVSRLFGEWLTAKIGVLAGSALVVLAGVLYYWNLKREARRILDQNLTALAVIIVLSGRR